MLHTIQMFIDDDILKTNNMINDESIVLSEICNKVQYNWLFNYTVNLKTFTSIYDIPMYELINVLNSLGLKCVRNITLLPFEMFIMFAKGKKDNWCAWIGRLSHGKVQLCCPLDGDYFWILKLVSELYDVHDLMSDVELLSDIITESWLDAVVKDDGLKLVHNLAYKYIDRRNDIDGYFWCSLIEIAYSEIYYGFIAEEHYKSQRAYFPSTKFGKYIKEGALYDVLINNEDIDIATKRSFGCNANDILADLVNKGYIDENFIHRSQLSDAGKIYNEYRNHFDFYDDYGEYTPY